MTENNEKIVIHVDPDLEELMDMFLENTQEDIKTMLDALGKDDYETVRITGHTLKGVGGGYGFDAITDIGRVIEQAAKDKDTETIRGKIKELEIYLERVEIVFD